MDALYNDVKYDILGSTGIPGEKVGVYLTRRNGWEKKSKSTDRAAGVTIMLSPRITEKVIEGGVINP